MCCCEKERKNKFLLVLPGHAIIYIHVVGLQDQHWQLPIRFKEICKLHINLKPDIQDKHLSNFCTFIRRLPLGYYMQM